MTLLSEGAYPAGGALLIGPDSTLSDVGLASGDTLMVQVQSKKPAPKKKTTKKKRARDDDDEEDVWVPSDGDDDDDAKARSLLGARASAVLDGGADDAATVAASFINCHEVRCPRFCRGAFIDAMSSLPRHRHGVEVVASTALSYAGPRRLDGRGGGHVDVARGRPPRRGRARAGRVRVRATPATLHVSTGARRPAPRRRPRSACASSRPTSPSPSSAPSSTGKRLDAAQAVGRQALDALAEPEGVATRAARRCSGRSTRRLARTPTTNPRRATSRSRFARVPATGCPRRRRACARRARARASRGHVCSPGEPWRVLLFAKTNARRWLLQGVAAGRRRPQQGLSEDWDTDLRPTDECAISVVVALDDRP